MYETGHERTGRLHLVDTPAQSGPAVDAVPGPRLRASISCRPSTLAAASSVRLDQAAQAGVLRAAAAARVPTEIACRLALEGSGAAQRAARLAGLSADRVVALLDNAAAERVVEKLGSEPLRLYASALAGADQPPTSCNAVQTMWVTDEASIVWEHAAADAGLDMDGWAREVLADPPINVVRWEVAAARRGRALSEWIFEQVLACVGAGLVTGACGQHDAVVKHTG
jgi:hypothetical protein